MACSYFKYLGSILVKDKITEKNVENKITSGWVKRRALSGVLCDRRMSVRAIPKCSPCHGVRGRTSAGTTVAEGRTRSHLKSNKKKG